MRDELEWKLEAAGSHDDEHGLEAGSDNALFPTGDDGPVAATSFSKLLLAEAGAKACLADQVGAGHTASVSRSR